MKMFSDCSGPCETCKIHYYGGCIAGHGDDDYEYASPEWIKTYVDRFPLTCCTNNFSTVEEREQLKTFLQKAGKDLALAKEKRVAAILLGDL